MMMKKYSIIDLNSVEFILETDNILEMNNFINNSFDSKELLQMCKYKNNFLILYFVKYIIFIKINENKK